MPTTIMAMISFRMESCRQQVRTSTIVAVTIKVDTNKTASAAATIAEIKTFSVPKIIIVILDQVITTAARVAKQFSPTPPTPKMTAVCFSKQTVTGEAADSSFSLKTSSYDTSIPTTFMAIKSLLYVVGRRVHEMKSLSKHNICWSFTCADTLVKNLTNAR